MTAVVLQKKWRQSSNQGLLNNRLGGVLFTQVSNPGPSGEDAATTSANLAMSDHRPAPGARLDRAGVKGLIDRQFKSSPQSGQAAPVR